MANDPAFLFYPGDYLRDTQCLSEKSQVSYDRIICEHMRTEHLILRNQIKILITENASLALKLALAKTQRNNLI